MCLSRDNTYNYIINTYVHLHSCAWTLTGSFFSHNNSTVIIMIEKIAPIIQFSWSIVAKSRGDATDPRIRNPLKFKVQYSNAPSRFYVHFSSFYRALQSIIIDCTNSLYVTNNIYLSSSLSLLLSSSTFSNLLLPRHDNRYTIALITLLFTIITLSWKNGQRAGGRGGRRGRRRCEP